MDLCIPNDIVVDILLRLPANSLARLRWACKYWFDLIIRDRSFIKMHYHNSTQCEIVKNNPCLLIRSYKGDLLKRFFNYTTYNASPEVKLDLPFKFKSFKILSSCNGLILLKFDLPSKWSSIEIMSSSHGLVLHQFCSTVDERVGLCIWNPCTNEYKVLPEPQLKFDCCKSNYGFGYDHTIDDYKVIKNAYYLRDSYGFNTTLVYTLRTNTWRSINEPMYLLCNDVGVFVNGALYWIIHGTLFSFDIEKEKCHEISTGRGMNLVSRTLAAFEGCLCLLPKPNIHGNDMYVMNKENNSWMKVCTVMGVMTKPLRFTENGNILMVGHSPSPGSWSPQSDLILLNTKERKYTNLNICHKSEVKEVYIESLVSLASDRTSKENEKMVSVPNEGKEIQMSA